MGGEVSAPHMCVSQSTFDVFSFQRDTLAICFHYMNKESASGAQWGKARVCSIPPFAQERRDIDLIIVGFDRVAIAQSRRIRLTITALERRDVEGTIVHDHPQPRDRV